MAQLLMQGTNYVNFIGRYCWVAAGEHGFEGVVVTERDEPQAVIGSTLHELAFPDNYRKHVENGSRAGACARASRQGHRASSCCGPSTSRRSCRCRPAASICTPPAARAACACSTSPSSTTRRFPSGSRPPPSRRSGSSSTSIRGTARPWPRPTTIAPDPTRMQRPENHEQPSTRMYGYIYVADKYEGLILVGAGTLLGRQSARTTSCERELTFNPGRHSLRRAKHHDRRHVRLHLLRRRPGGRVARRSQASRT